MAIDAISTTTSVSLNGWMKEQATEEAVNQLFVQKFKEIVSSYEERKKAASLNDLATGPSYPNEHALALEKWNQAERLDYLVKRHAFCHGFPPIGFDHIPNPHSPTKLALCIYQLQKGVLPTQALDNVKTGRFSLIDCGNAIELGRYETLLEVFGEKLFNACFSAEGDSPLKLHPHTIRTPLFTLGLMKEERFDVHAISHQFGDNVYFSNTQFYPLKHLNGEAAGFNAVCISQSSEQEKKYIAFGLPVEGKTESGMNEVLREEFNKRPMDLSLICTEVLANHLREEAKEKEAEFTEVSGQKISSFTIDRKAFESAIQRSNHTVGLRPVAHRFDIEGIRKYLD